MLHGKECKYLELKEPIETNEKIFQGTIILQFNVSKRFEKERKNTIRSENGTTEQNQDCF